MITASEMLDRLIVMDLVLFAFIMLGAISAAIVNFLSSDKND